MKVIIAGSRGFKDYALLKQTMNDLDYDVTQVISGTARGADELGEKWAKENNIPVKQYPADWAQHGRKAGYVRNMEMVLIADGLVAFWDGKSRGTSHTINLAKQKNIPVKVVKYD